VRITEGIIRNYLVFAMLIGQITAPDEIAVSSSVTCNLFVDSI